MTCQNACLHLLLCSTLFDIARNFLCARWLRQQQADQLGQQWYEAVIRAPDIPDAPLRPPPLHRIEYRSGEEPAIDIRAPLRTGAFLSSHIIPGGRPGSSQAFGKNPQVRHDLDVANQQRSVVYLTGLAGGRLPREHCQTPLPSHRKESSDTPPPHSYIPTMFHDEFRRLN
jgi:hypothetical protein